MYIKRISIKNFRGIRELNWELKNKFICLIGPGDSTKTTILEAIDWVLYPYWNINVNDHDFYNCNIENNIIIEVTLGNIPDNLVTEETYGLYLRKDVDNTIDNDEPEDREEAFITIRLEVNQYYEQEWLVVNNRLEGKKISAKDRAKLKVGRIGEYFYRDFNFGKNSVLKKYGEDLDDLDKTILKIYRDIREKIDFSEEEKLKTILKNVEGDAKVYGIAPKNKFNAKIDVKNSELGHSNINIYDGEIPVIYNGTGTKRLMSSAMNISKLANNSIILIDEIEYGLEPYRLRQLIKQLKESSIESQIIFTSHSPISVVEADVSNIIICKSNQGKTECIDIPSELQSTIRTMSEALLSKKVIVVEGKTELGLIRSLDRKWSIDDKCIEYYGVSVVDGNGGVQTCKRAKELNILGYNVAVFIDSDDAVAIKDSENLESVGIKVVKWNDNVSTDERIFLDMPKRKIQLLIDAAADFHTLDKVNQWIQNKIPNSSPEYFCIESIVGELEGRKILGKIAKEQSWFKRIDRGEILGDIIKDNYDEFSKQSDIIQKLEELKAWSYGS